MFASMFGFIIGSIVLFVLLAIIGSAIISSISLKTAGKEESVSSNSILHIPFDATVAERVAKSDFDFLNSGDNAGFSMEEFKRAIRHAKEDEKIKGIFLDFNMGSGIPGMANATAIREELIDFKKSGKFIYSYSEMYTPALYYLASVSDSIFLNPKGIFMFTGFSSEQMFVKNMLEKLDVKIELIKKGNYKGAGEMFTRENLSDYNREQIVSYLNSTYTYFLQNIADARNMPALELRAIAENFSANDPKTALQTKMVDRLVFMDEITALLMQKTDAKKEKDLKLVGLNKYTKTVPSGNDRKNKSIIAIVYANGEIMSGTGDENTVGSDGTMKAIRQARLDSNVKAVLLRVNSPGGSALASDVINREIELTKLVKPVVVSMGNVAASGGYLIAAKANRIFAQPNTITGSIGVFATVPNIEGLMKNKIGITFDRVETHKGADFININRPMNDAERLWFQRMVDETYADFVGHVSAGRNLPLDSVYKIAEGRVYSGQQAYEIGLVDELGDMDDALKYTAKLVNIEGKYRTMELPKLEDPFKKLMKGLSSSSSEKALLEAFGPIPLESLKKIKNLVEKRDFLQTRMEFDLIVK